MFKVTIFVAAVLAVSIQASELKMPSFAFAGERVTLSCNISPGDFPVKSLTWSKDGKQFYHYTNESENYSEVNGVVVNRELSTSSNNVVLESVTLDSSGLYTCKVEIDDPLFDVAEVSGTLKTVEPATRTLKKRI